VANLCLVQSWFFDKSFSISLNAPSWSISCELFFYLSFPLLIRGFVQSWPMKMFLSLSMVALSLVAMIYCGGPDLDNAAHLFIKTNPLCRIYEFVLGMTIALAYRRYGSVLKPGIGVATLIETLAIVLVATELVASNGWVSSQRELAVVGAWLRLAGVAPVYGILIYVMACGRGLVSRFLSSAFLVHLGEISFSLYMLHCLVLSWFISQRAIYLYEWSAWQKVACVAGLSLLLSHINYRLIEMPGKSALTKFAKNGFKFLSHSREAKQVRFVTKIPFVAMIATITLICFLNCFSRSQTGFCQTVSRTKLDQMLQDQSFKQQDELFGDQFCLRASKKNVSQDEVQINLVWQSAKNQRLLYATNVDLLDINGRRIQRKVCFQDADMRSVDAGAILEEQVDFKLTEDQIIKIKKIGVSIADPTNHSLYIQNGQRDSNNERLLIELN